MKILSGRDCKKSLSQSAAF